MSSNPRERKKNFSNQEFNEPKEDETICTSNIPQKKEMISFKQIQNFGLTTYDCIFMGRKFFNTITEDYKSFIKLLNSIKNQYNPKMLQKNYNIEEIKEEGKIYFNNNNLTDLIPLNNSKEYEISINHKYISTGELNGKCINFYGTKSFFKGKHCFEIQILNKNEPFLAFGIINISDIGLMKDRLKHLKDLSFNALEQINTQYLNIFKLPNPIFYEEGIFHYNHFITYGDIISLGYDLDQKILFLYLNGILRASYILKVNADENCSYAPIICLGGNTEIIFNPGPYLIHQCNFREFRPLDEKDKNNYESSQLIKVTDEFMNILINHGSLLIMHKSISYSDIMQIYHIIFEFLGNISFQHSYLVLNSFINSFLSTNIDLNDALEIFYIYLKYILNVSKDKKTILKNLFLNLAESIHILLKISGLKEFNDLGKLFKLLTYIFTKKEIIDFMSKMKKTTTKLFKAIFVSPYFCDFFLKNESLDFKIINNQKNLTNMVVQDDSIYFPKINISKNELQNIIKNFQPISHEFSNKILNYFKELVSLLYKNGTDTQNKKIFNIFKIFLENEINDMMKSDFIKNKSKITGIFKNIFLPLMNEFNKKYEKKEFVLSIKKYLTKKETDGEKLGGTINQIFRTYAKEIPNFEKLQNETIDDYINVFFAEFLYFFFIKENSYNVWSFFIAFVKIYTEYSNFSFLNSIKNKSFEKQFISLTEYFYDKISQFFLNDLGIFLIFLYNLFDFILNELYPKKLIYFLPELIFLNSELYMTLLKSIVTLLRYSYDHIIRIDNNAQKTTIRNDFISKLENLCHNCIRQYVLLSIRILNDENIKKLSTKCNIIEYLKDFIDYFTEEDICSVFNFLNIIHNNAEYKRHAINFMRIFGNDMSEQNNNNYNFGTNLIKLIKNKKDFLRVLIILLYSSMNASLTKLEEIFGEYKFQPKSNQNANDNEPQNIPVNRVENIIFGINRNSPLILFSFRNINPDKLVSLGDCFKDTSNEFIKLIYFYKLASNIIELYDMNSFEGKYLYDLLLSLNNIIFSSSNISKLLENKETNENRKNQVNSVILAYKLLLRNINLFYNIIIENIIRQNNKELLTEISRQRNIYHFKDILQFFQKFNPSENENEDNYATLKEFIALLEQIVSEENTIESIFNDAMINEIGVSKSGKKIEKNICSICTYAVIDTHILPCEHSVCRNCFLKCISENKVCPFCRVDIKGIKEDPNFKI